MHQPSFVKSSDSKPFAAKVLFGLIWGSLLGSLSFSALLLGLERLYTDHVFDQPFWLSVSIPVGFLLGGMTGTITGLLSACRIRPAGFVSLICWLIQIPLAVPLILSLRHETADPFNPDDGLAQCLTYLVWWLLFLLTGVICLRAASHPSQQTLKTH